MTKAYAPHSSLWAHKINLNRLMQEIITNLQDKTRAQWGENWQAEKYGYCRSLLIGKPLSVITYTKPH